MEGRGRQPGTLRLFASGTLGIAAFTTLGVLAACSPDRLVSSDPPSTVVTPSALTTPDGAMALYNGAVNLFASMYGGGANNGDDSFVISTGLLTDEFSAGADYTDGLDQRTNSLTYDAGSESVQSTLYQRIQGARVAAYQAREALQRYGTGNVQPLVARMYAYEAYSIIFLAEYFCNGVPLSQTELGQNPVYGPGLTTQQLYDQASALLDTALTLSGDSAGYANLAKVGKGRLLLDEGQFAAASAAVADVPQTFVYNVEFKAGVDIVINGSGYIMENRLGPANSFSTGFGQSSFIVTNQEGGVGLVWNTDPRVALAPQSYADNQLYPSKYSSVSSPIRLADGIEAQLIQAEADLQTGSSAWLTILQNLRNTCTSTSGCAPVSNLTSTSYTDVLADSATALGRLHTLMSERARWLYATGHREGDLRRLLRAPYDAPPYSLSASDLYPSGVYADAAYGGYTTAYGPDVVAIPGRNEILYNNKYKGCFDLNP
jgi:hypothetical protein